MNKTFLEEEYLHSYNSEDELKEALKKLRARYNKGHKDSALILYRLYLDEEYGIANVYKATAWLIAAKESFHITDSLMKPFYDKTINLDKLKLSDTLALIYIYGFYTKYGMLPPFKLSDALDRMQSLISNSKNISKDLSRSIKVLSYVEDISLCNKKLKDLYVQMITYILKTYEHINELDDALLYSQHLDKELKQRFYDQIIKRKIWAYLLGDKNVEFDYDKALSLYNKNKNMLQYRDLYDIFRLGIPNIIAHGKFVKAYELLNGIKNPTVTEIDIIKALKNFKSLETLEKEYEVAKEGKDQFAILKISRFFLTNEAYLHTKEEGLRGLIYIADKYRTKLAFQKLIYYYEGIGDLDNMFYWLKKAASLGITGCNLKDKFEEYSISYLNPDELIFEKLNPFDPKVQIDKDIIYYLLDYVRVEKLQTLDKHTQEYKEGALALSSLNEISHRVINPSRGLSRISEVLSNLLNNFSNWYILAVPKPQNQGFNRIINLIDVLRINDSLVRDYSLLKYNPNYEAEKNDYRFVSYNKALLFDDSFNYEDKGFILFDDCTSNARILRTARKELMAKGAKFVVCFTLVKTGENK